ncbi:MAG: 16S rRNA (guanine(527)-N(7))-methyltransferase RsmG [Jatrophihabitantaceae bacterium]
MPGRSAAAGDVCWPAAAEQAFGARLPLARRYADLLTTRGIEHGLLGPREAERIWERHLLNCAALTDLLPNGARVVDVGSGAGLPGLVLAIRRPDLRVELVESLRRRTDFLTEAVSELGLTESVRVIRGRAEDPAVIAEAGSARWVTARAVAPIDRLVRWCLPLLDQDGCLLAMKGRSAAEELRTHRDVIRRAGGRDLRVVQCQVTGTDEAISVIVVRRAETRSRRGSS